MFKRKINIINKKKLIKRKHEYIKKKRCDKFYKISTIKNV